MPKVKVAEILLSLFVRRERAASIVGDLLEFSDGPEAYWWAVFRTLFGFSWRFGLMGVGMAAIELVIRQVFDQISPIPHRPGHTAALLDCCSVWLIVIAFASASRFGRREPLTWLSLSVWLLAAVGDCSLHVPYVAPVCAILAVATMVTASSTASGRRALWGILVGLMAAGAGAAVVLAVECVWVWSCGGWPFRIGWPGLADAPGMMTPIMAIMAVTSRMGPEAPRRQTV
jgi:hypothetical protein